MLDFTQPEESVSQSSHLGCPDVLSGNTVTVVSGMLFPADSLLLTHIVLLTILPLPSSIMCFFITPDSQSLLVVIKNYQPLMARIWRAFRRKHFRF